MNRPICKECNENPAAINYKIDGITHYRTVCASCIRKSKKTKPVAPAWHRAGYKKKGQCERCNFVASNAKTQMRVYYLDGNLKNTAWTNLKTICLNCSAAIQDSKLGWKPADLVADF